MGFLKDYLNKQADKKTTEIVVESSSSTEIVTEIQLNCTHTSEVEDYEVYTYEVGGDDIEIIIEEEVIVVEQQTLPFSLCAGEFWADGLRTVYGPRHLVLGYTNSVEVKTTETSTAEVGPMCSGLIIEIGKGGCEVVGDDTFFHVNLNVVDFKMSNENKSIKIDHDANREAEKCQLEAKNVHRILAKFAKFTNRLNWKSLTDEYNESPIEFYKRYLEMFYPATLHIYVNTASTIDWDLFDVIGYSGKQTLLNRKSIYLNSEGILSWPPASFHFSPKEYIELIEMISETEARIVTRIERFETLFMFPFIADEADVIIMDERLKIGLSFEYVNQVVTKYVVKESSHHIITELPFPTEPAAFWKEAITTIYGGGSDRFLLLGVTNELNIRFGDDSHDETAMLSGLTVKINEVKEQNSQGKPEFSLHLKIVDFKMATKDEGIDISYDGDRDGGSCVITSENTDEIIERFSRFTKRVTWTSLVHEYEQNKVRFFKKYLQLFYPASFTLSFNIKKTIHPSYLDFPGFETETVLINRETIFFKTTKITKFPPTNFNITPVHNIEFVNKQHPTVIVITVGKFDTTFVTPELKDSDITVVQEVVSSTITFEFVREKVTKYIITRLPFPSCPAKFWAEAIRVLYGERHLLIGTSDSFAFKEKTSGTDKKVDKMHQGIVLEIGEGTCTRVGDKTVIQVLLELNSFKMVDGHGGIEIEDDTSRRREPCSLVLGHGDKVIDWFNGFTKDLDFLPLIVDFHRDPKAFYRKHIHRFYPAVIQIGLNIRKVIDGTKVTGFDGTVSLINRETVWITSEEILNFPPSQTEFISTKPIEFVTKDKPTEVIIYIEKFAPRVINLHIEDKKHLHIIREILDCGLTVEFVREKVIKYIDLTEHHDVVELPFPSDPVQFWIEGLRVLYGPEHLLLGLSETFKFKKPTGKPIDFGNMLNGLTYRIKEVTTKPKDKEIQITFDIIDFKLVSKDGKTKIHKDPKKPDQEITIRVKNTKKILEIFEGFKKPANWKMIVEEFEREPKDFYKTYLELFFPADISISLHLRNEHEHTVYVTKDIVQFHYEIVEFPPKNLQICPKKPIKLVDENDSNIVVYIEEFDSKMTYPTTHNVYDVKFVKDVLQFDLTYEIIHKHVTHYIISENLPFSTCPGSFWKDALVAIYGKDHLLFGISSAFNITTPAGKVIDLGTMLSALTFRITTGTSTNREGDTSIQVFLEILDFKMTSRKPGFEVILDTLRKGDQCLLKVKDPEDVFIKFRQLFAEKNWDILVQEYTQGPKQFYMKYIELFTPSSLTLAFNTKTTIDKKVVKVPGTEDTILVNREVIVITYDKVKQFPPTEITVITRDPIELVERDNPNKVIVTVSRLEIKLIYELFNEKVEITDRQKAIDFGITFEYIIKYTKKYVQTGKWELGGTETDLVEIPDVVDNTYTFGLPFPLCPGEFWAAAVKHIYGHKVLMLGSSDFTIGGKDLGSLHTGVIIEIGQGSCTDEGEHLLLNFKITDIKMVHEHSGIEVVQDISRPRIACNIISIKHHKVAYKFNQFANPMKWKALSAEYFKNPVTFYKKHIEAFYPAVIKFGLNLKLVIDGSQVKIGFTEKKTLINMETIWFTSEQILSFPPSNIKLIPKGPVTLVEKTKPKVPISILETIHTHLVHFHPNDKDILLLIQKMLHSGLTIDFVREYVTKYVIIEKPVPKLPFSLVPAQFWTDAIKTVYGEHFVFFGLTDSFKVKGPRGELTFGPFHNGFSIKFVDVTETLDKNFHIKFQIIDYKVVSENDDIEITHDVTKGGSVITLIVKDETRIIDTILQFKKHGNWTALIDEHDSNKMTFYEKYIDSFYPATLSFKLDNLTYVIKGKTAKLLGFDTPLHLCNKTVIEYVDIIHQFPPLDLVLKPTKTVEFIDCEKKTVVITYEEEKETTWILPFRKDKYDIDFVKELFLKGLTIEIIHHRVITHIVAKRLPFSVNPAVFFSDAIKYLYGPGTLLLGTSPVFNVTLQNGKVIDIGPMLNGLTIEYGTGHYEEGEDITVELVLTDFKMTDKKSGFQIEFDDTREGYKCHLVVDNTKEVIERFITLTHEQGWDTLAKEYTSDVGLFYKKYIHLFYPCSIKADINLKYTVSGNVYKPFGFSGRKVFFNKEIIHIHCPNITEFPPLNLDLTPLKPVELVGVDSDITFLTIKDFKTTWTRPILKDDTSFIILRKLITNGLTFEYVLVTVPKYIVIECNNCISTESLPFPLCPGDFWAEAIKTIYGTDSTLLFGNTNLIEITDEQGNPIDDGPLLSAILLNISKGTCETLGTHDSIKVKFDIVDFKMTTKGGKITIEYDHERKGGKCILEAKNVVHINGEFNKFANPGNWVRLSTEFRKDKVAFYKKYIGIFFPAVLKLSFNMNTVHENVTIVNRELITIVSDEILNWPPSSFDLHLTKDVEFVEPKNRVVVVIRIIKLETTLHHLEITEKEDLDQVLEVIKIRKLNYEFIIHIVLKYILKESEHKIPDLPFPHEPLEFWKVAITTLIGDTDFFLSLGKDFNLNCTDGTVMHFGPLLSGMTFKLVDAVLVGTEYQLQYKITDLKVVSNDGSLEIDQDDVSVGVITITTKDAARINALLEKYKVEANWTTVIQEYELSPIKFFQKHIEVFYPAEMKMTVLLRYTIGGTRVLVAKEPIHFTGEVTRFKHDGVVLVLQNPLILVETRDSPNIIAKVIIMEKRWIYPVIKDDYERKILKEIVLQGSLTYVFVREKVYKYIIAPKLPFPICPGEFFAQAIKTVYSEGQLFLGIMHHLNLQTEGGVVDIGPFLGAMTIKVHEGVSWEYTHDKSIRITLHLLDFKMVRRDGGVEIEDDNKRERVETYLVVNNTDEIFKKFAEFFNEDRWDQLSNDYTANPKKFYQRYLSIFFPSTINFGGALKFSFDGSEVAIPGVVGKQEYVTKDTVHFHFGNVTDYPTGDMRIKNKEPLELIKVDDPSKVLITIDGWEAIFIYPVVEDKADQATIDEVIISGLTFKFVFEMVSKYIVTKLPFPTDPGVFWETAIRTISGEKHLLLGVSAKPNITHPDNTAFEAGPILMGILTSIGRGSVKSTGETREVSIALNLLDVKMSNWDGAVEIEYDSSRAGEVGQLVSHDSKKIFDQFAEFADPSKWEALMDLYDESEKKFYEKYVKVFYPARFAYNMNVTASIGAGKGKIRGYKGATTLVSKDAFSLVCVGVSSFPPPNFFLTPSSSIQLLDKETVSTVGAIIERRKLIWTHPSVEEKSEQEICLRSFESGISFDFIRKMVPVYMDVPVYRQEIKVHFDYVEL